MFVSIIYFRLILLFHYYILLVGMMGSKTLLDENKLVLHKYPDTPSTTLEAKQCSAQLSLTQLKLIECSFKSIDFGCVTPNSISKKSLSFLNGFDSCISVRLEGTYGNLFLSVFINFLSLFFYHNSQ